MIWIWYASANRAAQKTSHIFEQYTRVRNRRKDWEFWVRELGHVQHIHLNKSSPKRLLLDCAIAMLITMRREQCAEIDSPISIYPLTMPCMLTDVDRHESHQLPITESVNTFLICLFARVTDRSLSPSTHRVYLLVGLDRTSLQHHNTCIALLYIHPPTPTSARGPTHRVSCIATYA